MDIQKFANNRPYLYHLTDSNNLPLIIKNRKLFSTNAIIDLSGNEDYSSIKNIRRPSHCIIRIDDDEYRIRDQRPISEKALSKCLTNNWSCSDFYYYLNDRVFTWATKDRLERHFNRYSAEVPIILRFDSTGFFELNSHAKFCRFNSGATRPCAKLGGIAPERGRDTFLPANEYNFPVGSVAEVTFENECQLPTSFYISNSPNGPWEILNIDII